VNYRHVQVGIFIFLVNGLLALLFAVQLARGGPKSLIAGLIVVIVVSLLFGILTVEVASGELRFRFGSGGWGKRVSLADIADVRPDRSRWMEGIGIRSTRSGPLYNVAPGAAVRITLHSGRSFRLGTDEPQALADAILAARDAG
jgi:hypothetical protein